MTDIKQYEELHALVTATNKDKLKTTDVEKLKRLLEDYPELWNAVNQAQNTALNLIRDVCSNKGVQVVEEANYFGIRRDLGYEQANALERMLIDHVALCWLRLNYAELRYSNIIKESIPINQAEYWGRLLSNTQKRYLRAVETLARIKRLRLPAMQVNIADKQVNIAGD